MRSPRPVLLLALALAGCPSRAGEVCPPCAAQPTAPSVRAASASASASASSTASASASAPPELELARATTKAGTFVVTRRLERGAPGFYARALEASAAPAAPAAAAAREARLDLYAEGVPSARLVDLDEDDLPEIVVDLASGPAGGERFVVFPSSGDPAHPYDGARERFAFRWLASSTSLDDAVKALAAAPHFDLSVPEACGAIDRARKPVEAWSWDEAASAFRRDKKDAPFSWSCSTLMRDGDAYWMPELRCSRFVPACEALLLSGGHGGTALPNEKYVFFRRVKGLLEVDAFAENLH